MAEDPKRDAVTAAHLRESQRSLILMFRSKGFPVAWVNRNAIDLLAQANVEYMEWLERHEPEQSPVGWLVTCAYRRGLNLLTSQGRGPGSTSIDAVFGLADESTPTPEQQALDDDRQRRLRKALGCLPQRERKLLSLVYFEDCSVREAGRRLGWRSQLPIATIETPWSACARWSIPACSARPASAWRRGWHFRGTAPGAGRRWRGRRSPTPRRGRWRRSKARGRSATVSERPHAS